MPNGAPVLRLLPKFREFMGFGCKVYIDIIYPYREDACFMTKKRIILVVVLLFGILFLFLSAAAVLGRSSDGVSGYPSGTDDGTAAVLSQGEAPLSAVCAHLLSTQWSNADDCHFHACLMPDCAHIADLQPCSGGDATCTERAVCTVCGAPYGGLADHLWDTDWSWSEENGHAHSCTYGCGQHSELQPHEPGPDATETSPQLCLVCGYEIAPVLAHVHTLEKVEEKAAACTVGGNIAYYICKGCSRMFYDAQAEREITDSEAVGTPPLGHDFAAATCTKAQTCRRNGCKAVQGAPLGHTPKAVWNSDEQGHWHVCDTCGARVGSASHNPGPEATAQAPQTCTECGYILKTYTGHVHSYDAIKCDASAHWYECSCAQTNGRQAHYDNNGNSKCDVCGYQLPKQPSRTDSSDQYAEEGGKMESILQPAQITLLSPVASGTLTKSTASATVDYSNSKDGYVMVKFTENTSVRLKVQVKGPTTTYTYNLQPQQWAALPLSDGNGNYNIKVFKNVKENKYSTALSLDFSVKLADEFAPFLRPNQYVNYEHAVNTMNKAAELAAGKTDTLEKVKAIYNYIISNITYDFQKAASVQSGYLPDLEQVLADKKGICFDYAALMTGMLRSQNIACKLIVGYADTAYHAWISVWTPEKGWVDEAIFFDGIRWQLMDPTYASSAGSAFVKQVNYTSKYIY